MRKMPKVLQSMKESSAYYDNLFEKVFDPYLLSKQDLLR